jgi:hypothetical protein
MQKIYLMAGFFLFVGKNLANAQEMDKAKVEADMKAAKTVSEYDSTKKWKLGSTFTAGFSDIGLSNWQGGGQQATTLTTLFTGYANYKNGKHAWDNYFEGGYGMTYLKDQKEIPFRKTDDRLILTSRYGYQMKKSIFASALVDFRSQFAPGYKFEEDVDKKLTEVLISDAFAPAWLVGSVGMEYKPSSTFYFFASPITSRITIVNNKELSEIGAFGVDPGKKIRSELGAYTNSKLTFSLMKNISLQTTLTMFMNYKTPALIDVFWDNNLLLTVNKYVTVNFSTNLIYDDDIRFLRKVGNNDEPTLGPGIQFRRVLSVGLVYKLI